MPGIAVGRSFVQRVFSICYIAMQTRHTGSLGCHSALVVHGRGCPIDAHRPSHARRPAAHGHCRHALLIHLVKLLLAHFLALRHGDVDGLAVDHLLVHLRHRLGGFLGKRKTHKAKALGTSVGRVTHHPRRGNGAKRRKFLAQLLVVDVIRQILDVQVHALKLGHALVAQLLKLILELLLSLSLFLGAPHVHFLAVDLLAVERVDGSRGLGRLCKVDKAKALAHALFVLHNDARVDRPVLLAQGCQLGLIILLRQVFEVDIGELDLPTRAVVAGLKVADKDLLALQQHAVDLPWWSW